MGKKKDFRYFEGVIIGFIFGFSAVFAAILGLVSELFIVVFRPVIFIPRAIVLLFIDTSSGIVTTPGSILILSLAVVSGVFYALVGLVVHYLIKSFIRKV